MKLILGLLLFCLSTSVVAQPCVVLLHGLLPDPWGFKKTEKRFQENYFVVKQHYPSRKKPILELATPTIDQAIEKCGDHTPIHFVTHSMGGILVREYLVQHASIENLGRVVMVVPPSHGSHFADYYHKQYWYRQWLGPAGQELGTDADSVPNQLPPINFDAAIIAANKNINPLAWMIPKPNDSLVAVENMKAEGMRDFIVLDHSHFFIMLGQDTFEQAVAFLESGGFERAARP